jgi:hypothetical protein
MRRHFGLIAVLTAVMVIATWWIGWWTVAIIGAAWGIARRGEGLPAATAAAAAGLAWTLLLALQASRGPVGELSRRLGGALALPGWAPLLATIAFPALLGGAAAALAGRLAPPAKRDQSA